MPWWWLLAVLMMNCAAVSAEGYCREKAEKRSCESLCDASGKNCVIRAAVILSQNTTTKASLSTVMPVLELANDEIKRLGLISSDIAIEWIPKDDKCDASYALISAIDSYADDCVHVIFGPVCEYALASIARIVKFLGKTGTPLLTVGGLSFDFVGPKTVCANEYHMLTRTGSVGFRDIAYFIIDLMKSFHWRKILIVNEPEGQYSVVGKTTCHLMMKTMAQYIKQEKLIYSSWDTTQNTKQNFSDNLRREMTMEFTSKYKWLRVFLIYQRHGRYPVVGSDTCYLQTNTLAQMLKEDAVLKNSYRAWEFIEDGRETRAKLVEQIGNNYGSE